MSLYGKYILPRIIDLAMRNKDAARVRSAWVPHARGDVLEVGIGSGLNLPYYTQEVRRVYGVDPSLELQRMAHKRVAGSYHPVEFLAQSAELPLPLPDACIDTVVVTWTLCSIHEVSSALREMRRVLNSSGRLIFVEHGRAADPRVSVWQDRLTPLWKRFTGGCHLNRKVDELVTASGFRITELQTSYLPGPHPFTFTYQGFAQAI